MSGKATENLSFEVDTWRNGDPEQGVNISGVINGEDAGQLAFTNGIILEDGSRKTGSMEIRFDPSKVQHSIQLDSPLTLTSLT